MLSPHNPRSTWSNELHSRSESLGINTFYMGVLLIGICTSRMYSLGGQYTNILGRVACSCGDLLLLRFLLVPAQFPTAFERHRRIWCPLSVTSALQWVRMAYTGLFVPSSRVCASSWCLEAARARRRAANAPQAPTQGAARRRPWQPARFRGKTLRRTRMPSP